MKGQMGLLEYVFLTFFIAIVVVVLFFFLSGFQITQFNAQQRKSSIDRALFLTKQVSNSLLFVKENGVFDDGKLTAWSARLTGCQELKQLFGGEWFFEVHVLGTGASNVLCDQGNYVVGSSCNTWSFCADPSKKSVSFDLPTNVYRNAGSQLSTGILSRTDLAVVKVGVYV